MYKSLGVLHYPRRARNLFRNFLIMLFAVKSVIDMGFKILVHSAPCKSIWRMRRTAGFCLEEIIIDCIFVTFKEACFRSTIYQELQGSGLEPCLTETHYGFEN